MAETSPIESRPIPAQRLAAVLTAIAARSLRESRLVALDDSGGSENSESSESSESSENSESSESSESKEQCEASVFSSVLAVDPAPDQWQPIFQEAERLTRVILSDERR
jgi:hypothetical protein